jgi:hypothetical protein
LIFELCPSSGILRETQCFRNGICFYPQAKTLVVSTQLIQLGRGDFEYWTTRVSQIKLYRPKLLRSGFVTGRQEDNLQQKLCKNLPKYKTKKKYK